MDGAAAKTASAPVRSSPRQTPPSAAPGGRVTGPAPRARVALLVGLWALLTAALALHQLGREGPHGFADELIWGGSAQSVAQGEGLTWEGSPTKHLSLYPYLIAPAWALFEHELAYRVALIVNAAVMTSVVFPTYLLARRVASFWWGLAAAAAAGATPAMVWAGYLMTEALAYPLTALALLAMVDALRRPGWRATLLALAASALAAGVRTQLLVLFGVFALAVLVDLLREGRGRARERVRIQRPALVSLGALAALGLLVLLAGARERVLGTYDETIEQTGSAGEILGYAADYVSVLAVIALLLPFTAMALLALRGEHWRHRELGPLLAVALSAVAVFLLIGAWSSSSLSPELRERYVFYPAPLLAACFAALPGRVSARAVAVATLAATAYLAIPGISGSSDWVEYTVLGVSAWAICMLVVGGSAALGLRRGGALGALLVVAPTLGFGLGVEHVRQYDANNQSEIFAGQYPDQRSFVDDVADGQAAFVRTRGTDRFAIWHFELWNSELERVYRVPDTDEQSGIGQQCVLELGSRGELLPQGDCAGRRGLPRFFVFQDPEYDVRMPNGRLRFEAEPGVRVYEVPAEETPRVLIEPASS